MNLTRHLLHEVPTFPYRFRYSDSMTRGWLKKATWILQLKK